MQVIQFFMFFQTLFSTFFFSYLTAQWNDFYLYWSFFIEQFGMALSHK